MSLVDGVILARIKNKSKKNITNNSSDPEKWVQILVKDSTRLAIKDYSNSNGLKMWAFVDLAVSEFIDKHSKFIPSYKMVRNLDNTPQNNPEPTPQSKPEPTPQSKPEPIPQSKPEPIPQSKPESTPQSKPKPTPQSKPKPTLQSKPEPTLQNKPKPTPQNKPKPTSQSKPEPTPQNRSKPKQQRKIKPAQQKKSESTKQDTKTQFSDKSTSNLFDEHLISILKNNDEEEIKSFAESLNKQIKQAGYSDKSYKFPNGRRTSKKR